MLLLLLLAAGAVRCCRRRAAAAARCWHRRVRASCSDTDLGQLLGCTYPAAFVREPTGYRPERPERFLGPIAEESNEA